MDIREAMDRCWMEVDLGAIRDNYRSACALSAPAKVICVLKANAYGTGAAVVGKALYEAGARDFAVASGDEAEELLAVIPEANVLTLGLVGETQAARLIEKGGIFTLFSEEQANTLIALAQKVGKPARVHLKADTGLYRLGFYGEDAADVIMKFAKSEHMKIEALYTHLALHNRDTDEAQFALFDKLDNALKARGLNVPMRHICDSIGMVRYPQRHMDAVRTGAWLYGNTPNGYEGPAKCTPTAAIKARIARIRTVAAGELLGYDDDHPLQRETSVATLTAGYADGLPRYNNTGFVEVRGKRAPVVGLACMDQMMIDVTDIPEAAAGDEVFFLGSGIGLREFAGWGALNRNEATARVARRVPRVYFDGDKPLFAVHDMF